MIRAPSPNCGTNYIIMKPSHVRIGIYDIYGKLIENIEESDHESGKYSIDWHASDLPGATYIIKLIVDDNQLMKKVVLID